MSIEETVSILDLRESNIKVRLLRARLALREYLTRRFGDELKQVVKPHHHDENNPAFTSAAAILEIYQNHTKGEKR